MAASTRWVSSVTARTLILMRHAQAEPFGHSDAERPLALRGRRQAAEVGSDLAAQGPIPDVALVSSATRTRQTWELLSARLEREVRVEFLDELYEAGPRSVLQVLGERAGEAATVMVVGHEPVMSALASTLASSSSDEHLVAKVRHGVPTASRSVLQFDGGWGELGRGRARLVAVERAAD